MNIAKTNVTLGKICKIKQQFSKLIEIYTAKTKRNARVNLQARRVVFQNVLIYIAKTKRNARVNLQDKTGVFLNALIYIAKTKRNARVNLQAKT